MKINRLLHYLSILCNSLSAGLSASLKHNLKINVLYGFLGVVLLFGFISLLNPHTHSKTDLQAMSDKPQEYMKGVFITIFTEEGHVKNHVWADEWAYRPEKSQSLLSKPYLTVFKKGQPPWYVSSKQGVVQQPTLGSIEEIQLIDEVLLERPKTKDAQALSLKTTLLYFFPKRQYAETDKAIIFTKPDLEITGDGLRAFLDTNSVELLNNVKTRYFSNP